MSKEKYSVPDSHKHHPHGHPPLPNPDVCRAREVLPVLVECLVHKPFRCHHSLAFGHGFFCHNPQAKEIAAKTKAAEKKGKGH